MTTTTMTTLGLSAPIAATKERYQWIQLSPFGDHPHPFGVQRLNRMTAEKMTRNFYSLWGIMRRCFAGLPIYVGHPDDLAFLNHPDHQDSTIYGRIQAIEPRRESLWALVSWSNRGRKLIENSTYRYLSPRWVMHSVGNNIYEPRRLISVGLTHQPNIPSKPLCGPSFSNNPFYTLTQILGIPYCQTFSAMYEQAANLSVQIAQRKIKAIGTDNDQKDKLHQLMLTGDKLSSEIFDGPNTKSITKNLAYYTTSPSPFLQKVEEYMKENGAPYMESWSAVRKKYPHLYSQLSN